MILAEKRGLDPNAFGSLIQNDVLKEFIARGTQIFPPAASLRHGSDDRRGGAEAARPYPTMAWLNSQAPLPLLPSLAQVLCMANDPVASARSPAPPNGSQTVLWMATTWQSSVAYGPTTHWHRPK